MILMIHTWQLFTSPIFSIFTTTYCSSERVKVHGVEMINYGNDQNMQLYPALTIGGTNKYNPA